MKLELYSPRRAVFGATLAVLIFGVPPSAADSIWIAAQTHGILRMGGGTFSPDVFPHDRLEASDTSMPVGVGAQAGWLHADQVGLFAGSEVFFCPLREEPGAIPTLVVRAGLLFVLNGPGGIRSGLSVSAGRLSVDSAFRGRDVRGATLLTQMGITFWKPLILGTALEGHLALQQGEMEGVDLTGLLLGFGVQKAWTFEGRG